MNEHGPFLRWKTPPDAAEKPIASYRCHWRRNGINLFPVNFPRTSEGDSKGYKCAYSQTSDGGSPALPGDRFDVGIVSIGPDGIGSEIVTLQIQVPNAPTPKPPSLPSPPVDVTLTME